MLYVGIDLAETPPYQVCLMREDTVAVERRIPNTAAGLRRLLQTVMAEEPEPAEVLFAVERPDSPFVDGLVSTGYTVYAGHLKVIDRYRDRFALGDTRTDRLGARCLAVVPGPAIAPWSPRTRALVSCAS